MKTVRSIVGRLHGQDTASPHCIAPRDPYAGDEALLWSGDYEDYLVHAARIGYTTLVSRVEHDRLDREFEQTYRAILDGQAPWSAIDPLAEALLVAGPLKHDGRPAGVAVSKIDDRQLADIAENQLPQVGLIGPDRVLGPWADERLTAAERIQVGAVMAFVPEVEPGVPPWARAIKRKPRPDADTRQSLRVMARTSPMLWSVQGSRLVPMLPMAAQLIPQGPIQGVPEGEAVIGRVVQLESSSYLAAGMALEVSPPAGIILRRVMLEWLRLRRRERRLSLEDALRERSEVLYRTAFEWLYMLKADA